MPGLRRALAVYRDDASRFRRFAAAVFSSLALARRKRREEKALAVAYRELGDRAKETTEARERKSFGSVEASEARLAKGTAELTVKTGAEAAARDGKLERTRVREGEIAVAEASWRDRQEEHLEKKGALGRIVREMHAIEEDLERPPEKRRLGRDEADLRRGPGELIPRRADAERIERAGREARDAAKALLDRERALWKEEETALSRALKAAMAEREAAEAAVNAAQVAHRGSLEDLGRSVALAGMDAPGLSGALGKAKGLLRTIDGIAGRIVERRAEAKVLRPAALRFSLVTGGAVAAVVLLAVLVVSVAGPGSSAGSGAAPGETAGTTTEAAAPPAPAVALPEAVRTAILATPGLATRG